jgi:phosphate starvation-inducible protein PhoH and related proteins
MSSAKVRYEDLLEFDPITGNQKKAFELWDEGENLVLAGSAGTGKTFIAMYLALEKVLEKSTEFDKVIVMRSVVAVREIGYLPGKLEEKTSVFEAPYKAVAEELLEDKAAWNKLTNSHQILFETTSFVRGKTFDRAIIIVDEMQNLNFHELDSVMTRAGENCRLIFCGDYLQTDFHHEGERNGLAKFLNIIERMKDFSVVQFGWDDIVRSGIVRDYIMTKEMIGIK